MSKFQITLILLMILSTGLFSNDTNTIYDFNLLDIDGNDVSLREYAGKTVMIVNVASRCGFTPQYEGLEALYEKYKDREFVVLGFPANDFLWQESGTNEEIKAFCTANYGVTFPMFSKIKVTGLKKNPLYKFLTEKETNPDYSGRITWNFNKFLINSEGKVVNRFESSTEPLSDIVIASLEQVLN